MSKNGMQAMPCKWTLFDAFYSYGKRYDTKPGANTIDHGRCISHEAR